MDVLVAMSAGFCWGVSEYKSVLGDMGLRETYIEDGKDIFTHSQPGPITSRDVGVVAAQSLLGCKVDGETEKKGNEPGKDDDVVVPTNPSHDSNPRPHPPGNKDGGQCHRGSGDGEDGRPPAGKVFARLRFHGGQFLVEH